MGFASDSEVLTYRNKFLLGYIAKWLYLGNVGDFNKRTNDTCNVPIPRAMFFNRPQLFS